MVFKIKNKVVIVSGGASGIGLAIVKELLRNGAKGVTIADISLQNGEKAMKELLQEFGHHKIIFALTDVWDPISYENAFKVTVDHFKNVDILFNNAGIGKDSTWEREVDTNLKGMINGMVLGLEKYLKNCKQSDEAVIVNTSSIAALSVIPTVPIYSATKAGIVALTKCWGHPFHYERTKVRVLAMCPGVTDTPILLNVDQQTLIPEYLKYYENPSNQNTPMQSPVFVAKEAMKLVEKAPNGSLWVIEESKPAYQFVSAEKKSFENNTLH